MRKFSFIFTFSAMLILPAVVFAADTLVPNCAPNCGWTHLVVLASNVLQFLIKLSVVSAAIMFAYAGFLYLSDGGSMNRVKEAHTVFAAVAVGIIIVLVAWLSVDTLMKSLTGKGVNEWSQQAGSSSIQDLR